MSTTPEPIIFLPFTEPDELAPSDVIGTLEDLGEVAGIAVPPVIDGWTGRARDFTPASTHALVAADAADGDSLLVRDVTIQAIVSVDLGQDAGPMTLIARGNDGSASEYYAFGLELEDQALAPGNIEIRWFWQTAAGVLKTQLPGVFQSLGNNRFFLLTATRRWESTTSVVCRYYVGDRLLAEVTSADGDIGGGTTGHTSVGGRKTAGAWGRFWSGAIDQLAVLNYEMTAEEVEATWARVRTHQPEGVARVRALLPPGAPRSWYADDTRMGKVMKVAGQGAGLVAAKADELVRNWLPDRTYLDTIERWERLLGLAANATESLDTRRTRVVAFLRRDNGYSIPKIKLALEELLDLDPTDIEILEFSNTITDAFATLEAERWFTQGGTWSIAAGALRLQVAGATNVFTDPLAVHARMPLSSGAGEVIAQAKMTYLTVPGLDVSVAGLLLYDYLSGDALWFGIYTDGVDYLVGWQKRIGGVLTARTSIATIVGAAAYLRIRRDPDVAGGFTLEHSVTAFDDDITSTVIAGGPTVIAHAGFGVVGTDASLSSGLDMAFDDFLCRTPEGDRPFAWFAFRDPGLPGTPDMIGANLTLRKLRPAHTHGAAITSKSLLCDDDSSGCDIGPLGGI